jgi:hypothetical protein
MFGGCPGHEMNAAVRWRSPELWRALIPSATRLGCAHLQRLDGGRISMAHWQTGAA